MKKILTALLALVLITTACSTSPVKSPAESSSGALFSDNFSDPSSGWDRFQNDTGVTDYSNVGYLIYIKTANIIKWANPSKTFQNNVRIEVDASMSDGPDDNAFGVICRYQDADNFYYFYISSDSFGGIGKKENGHHSVISSSDGKLLKIDGVNMGAATNHLRADCIGSTLTLYVNGTQVATTTDSAFTGGDVGLIARTYDTGGTDIVFTNFYVYKPKVPISRYNRLLR
jgi:pectate lyase